MRQRAVLWVLAVATAAGSWSASASGPAPWFARPSLVAGISTGWTEPRVAIAPDGTAWTVTNDPHSGAVIVLSSRDGRQWTRTPAALPGQSSPSTDADIVVTRTGRVVVTELDGSGLRFVTGYSDNRGRSWTMSRGTAYADQDRPWLATGPDDRVYLLFHNLFSGSAVHEMFVATSTDGGASFGAPVPVAPPGSQAFLDLQCADSGAPSAIVVDQRTGRIYAVFGTRSSRVGGCGASATGQFEINVVGETRVWVATSATGGIGSWSDHLAFDATPDTLSASFETAAVDGTGALYVGFAQTARPYPDFGQAAIRYVWSRDAGNRWHRPITVTPGAPIGTYDPTLVATGSGNLAVAYYQGSVHRHGPPVWSLRLAVVTRAASRRPDMTHGVIDPRPAYEQSANDMGGSCASGPLAGAQNGLVCNRASDDFGLALTRGCALLAVYPMTANPARGAAPGTWSAVQDGGPRLCPS